VGCVVLIHSCLRSGTDVVSFGRFGFGVSYYGERRCACG
jgi:hypothetical protein